jgi:phosphonate transport system substrate-binding protein
MQPIRFAVTSSVEVGGAAFEELRGAVARAGGPAIEPVFVPNYVALFQVLNVHAADAGWCPPLVARDLVRVAAADPIATVLRDDRDCYYSAIVARTGSGIDRLERLPDARFGWVSRLSAAGYVVPRAYLRFLRVPLEFREERFFHSHARLVAAIDAGEIDAGATYAHLESGAFRLPRPGADILATVGPIPGDVIVAARWLDARVRTSLAGSLHRAAITRSSLLARLMDATSFGPVPEGHLASLERWVDRVADALDYGIVTARAS